MLSQEQLNNSVNGSFVHIMKFLEELENLITLTQNGKDIKQKLEKILDQGENKAERPGKSLY